MRHPDYSILAARVLASGIYKNTQKTFSRWVSTYGSGMYACLVLQSLVQFRAGPRPILRPDFVAAVTLHAAALDGAILHSRDRGFYLYVLYSSRCCCVAVSFAKRVLATLCKRCTSTICSVRMVSSLSDRSSFTCALPWRFMVRIYLACCELTTSSPVVRTPTLHRPCIMLGLRRSISRLVSSTSPRSLAHCQ